MDVVWEGFEGARGAVVALLGLRKCLANARTLSEVGGAEELEGL